MERALPHLDGVFWSRAQGKHLPGILDGLVRFPSFGGSERTLKLSNRLRNRRAIPWLHYVPVQVDLSDLHNILAFFRGDLDGRGAHSEAAEQIARAGRDWALHHYRYADLQAYQFRGSRLRELALRV